MAVNLRRPILVGGVSLSFALWLLQSWHQSVEQVGELTVIGAITLLICFWLVQQSRAKNVRLELNNSPLDRATVEKAIAIAEAVVNQLETEAQNHQANALLRQKLVQLPNELDRQEMHLAVTGGKAVGKTTVIEVLESNWVPQMQQKLCFVETLPLFTKTEASLENAIASDLVLFITNGDLTDSEFQTLQQLKAAYLQRLMLVFNKQDQYLPDERAVVLHSLRQRMQPMLATEDVVAIAASPNSTKVRQYHSDGAVQEWMEKPAPDIKLLIDQLNEILVNEGQQLIWATTMRAAVALKTEAKTALNEIRRSSALPVIEQYQWIAAAAAFANPVPALDLLATSAVNVQLIIELSVIYQQKFSLQQAQTVAKTMVSLMVKLGLVELSTKAIATVLKSNAVTFVAGGVVQGVSAAYLTRLAGLSLIEYFQQQEALTNVEAPLNLDKLGQTLQKVFQQNQQVANLQSFVGNISRKLVPGTLQV